MRDCSDDDDGLRLLDWLVDGMEGVEGRDDGLVDGIEGMEDGDDGLLEGIDGELGGELDGGDGMLGDDDGDVVGTEGVGMDELFLQPDIKYTPAAMTTRRVSVRFTFMDRDLFQPDDEDQRSAGATTWLTSHRFASVIRYVAKRLKCHILLWPDTI